MSVSASKAREQALLTRENLLCHQGNMFWHIHVRDQGHEYKHKQKRQVESHTEQNVIYARVA